MANNNNIDLGLIVALIKKLGGSAGDINKQIADYINAHTNIADGIAGLDSAGQVAPTQLPDRNHQLILPYIVELTSNEMANAIDDKTEDYGTIAVGQLATPTTNDVFVVGHLYQYVSEEGVYNWNDVTEAVEINSTSTATLPLDTIKIGNNVYANTYVIETDFPEEARKQDLTQVLTAVQIQLIKEHPQNVVIRSFYDMTLFRYVQDANNIAIFVGFATDEQDVLREHILYISFDDNTYDLYSIVTSGNNSFSATVLPSSFVEDNTYAAQGFNFKAAIPLDSKVNTYSSFATVAFSMADAMSGNYAPYCETYDGGVYIWAKEKPTSNLIIPSIEVIY